MRLPFLDRREEVARLTRLVQRTEGALGVLYGRRRCGKSRLLREVVPAEMAVHFLGDDREAILQRSSLAAEVDLVAEDPSSGRFLVGEVEWAAPRSAGRLLRELHDKIARLPFAQGREVIPTLWLASAPEDLTPSQVVTPRQVLDALR